MVGALNRKLDDFYYRCCAPKYVELLYPAKTAIMRWVNRGKMDPLALAAWVVGLSFWLLLLALFILLNLIEARFGIDPTPSSFPLAIVFYWGAPLGMSLFFGFMTIRILMARRLHRFFDHPFCYHCEYEIPELVCTPEEAAECSSTLRCTECGKVIPRIVATRQAVAG